LTDREIIDLYFRRSEQAIAETDARYGPYCYQIAYNVLIQRQDAEECVNDTYLTVWNRIPPTQPVHFSVFLARITRGLAIDRWRSGHAKKRGQGQLPIALHELDSTLSSGQDADEALMVSELTRLLNTFLRSLPDTERRVFLCRYWYIDSIAEISRQFGFSQSKVKSMLLRTRKKLKAYLFEKGGYAV
jgi:RNA polymerase sigma-70 factor (ECF subfamily)